MKVFSISPRHDTTAVFFEKSRSPALQADSLPSDPPGKLLVFLIQELFQLNFPEAF